ncbi:hypothetical protein BH24CHL9_BH24CHL9_04560 [soil metagenome]
MDTPVRESVEAYLSSMPPEEDPLPGIIGAAARLRPRIE